MNIIKKKDNISEFLFSSIHLARLFGVRTKFEIIIRKN